MLVTGELADIDIPGIEMVRSAEELSRKHLADYSFLFIGGGNTFKLLYDIKRVNMFEPIREYLQNGGVAFGGSAGPSFSEKIWSPVPWMIINEAGLKDTAGFDLTSLAGLSTLYLRILQTN